MNEKRLKIGAVSFINAYPLTKNLEYHDIVYDIPSVLADKLKNEELDIALISSIEYAKSYKNYRYISELCISSKEKVDSILLFSKKNKLGEIRNLKYDISSRSSVAMLKIIFNNKYGFIPKFSSCEKDEIEDYMIRDNSSSEGIDAVLLIGDNALKYKDLQISSDKGFNKIFDLGSEWYKLFKLPFVYAIWVVRNDVKIDDLYFVESYNKNKLIVKDLLLESDNYSEFNLNYLQNTINYILTEDHLKSLDTFFSEAAKIGIIKEKPNIVY